MTEYYKQVKLLVGYNEVDDIHLDYFLKILQPFQKNKARFIQFNPPNETEEYGKTNLALVQGKILCQKDKREVKHGDIVEMRFEETAENGMQWVPQKIRSDKVNPQWFLSANNIWSTLRNPITTSMIQGDYVESMIQDKENEYYMDNDRESSKPLRKFHNWIKYCLITGLCENKNVRILDTSIGRGGDIEKYIQSSFNCQFLLGMDINSVNEASRRYYYMKKNKTPAVFLRYNTGKEILSKEGMYATPEFPEKDVTHSDAMISILYKLNTPIPEIYKPIREKYQGLAKEKFTLISCQFSLHYYFESETLFNGFVTNLVENCKTGGYFIGTCYDGKRVFELLTDRESIEYRDAMDNLVYRISKQYDMTEFGSQLFGNRIDVYMDSIDSEYSEYLVDFERFVSIMKQNGFELVKPAMKPEYDIFQGPMNSFSTILSQLSSFESNSQFRKYYSASLELQSIPELQLLSSLNNYFIFKKN